MQLSVLGMTCQSCVSSVTKTLSNLSDVDNINVDLSLERATVSSSLPPLLIIQAIEDAGFTASVIEVEQEMKEINIDIVGMTCMVRDSLDVIQNSHVLIL